MNMKNICLILYFLLFSVFLFACSAQSPEASPFPGEGFIPAPPLEEPSEESPDAPVVLEPQDELEERLVITAVGDIMVHESQWLSQKTGEDSYDFTDNFMYVRDIFKASDLSLANLETTITDKRRISSYPRFNSPEALLDGMRYAGINILGMANNHSMDSGMAGIFDTISAVEKRGFHYTGSRKDPESSPFTIEAVKGMRIGIAAFSTAYFGSGNVVINNISAQGMEKHINYMELTHAEKAFKRLKPVITEMKESGAEFIVLMLHWGIEYVKSPDSYQKTLAQLLMDEGVDLILGAHPHMVQEMAYMKSTDGVHEGLVAYSMGNFLSNQRNEILNMTGTEDGLMVRITLKRNDGGKVEIEKSEYIPTWISRKEKGEAFAYRIIPIGRDPVKTASAYGLDIADIQESLENTLSVMKDDRIVQMDIED